MTTELPTRNTEKNIPVEEGQQNKYQYQQSYHDMTFILVITYLWPHMYVKFMYVCSTFILPVHECTCMTHV